MTSSVILWLAVIMTMMQIQPSFELTIGEKFINCSVECSDIMATITDQLKTICGAQTEDTEKYAVDPLDDPVEDTTDNLNLRGSQDVVDDSIDLS